MQDSQSCKLLTEAGIEWEYVPDLEQEILSVAMEGHTKDGPDKSKGAGAESKPDAKPTEAGQPAGVGAGSASAAQEHASAEARPRNPKKRMMEAPPGSEESES